MYPVQRSIATDLIIRKKKMLNQTIQPTFVVSFLLKKKPLSFLIQFVFFFPHRSINEKDAAVVAVAAAADLLPHQSFIFLYLFPKPMSFGCPLCSTISMQSFLFALLFFLGVGCFFFFLLYSTTILISILVSLSMLFSFCSGIFLTHRKFVNTIKVFFFGGRKMENSKEREKKEIHSISNELSFGHSDVSLLIQFIFHLLLLYSSRGVLICENWQTNRFVLSRLIFDLINQSIRKVMNCGMAERERERDL